MTVDVEDGQSLQLRGVPGVGVLLGLVLRVDLQRQLGAAQRLGRAAVTDLLEGGVPAPLLDAGARDGEEIDRKSTRLNSSHVAISYADCCLKKKKLQGDIEGEVTLSHSVRDTIGSQFDTGPVGFDGHEYYIWKSRLTKVTVAIGMS